MIEEIRTQSQRISAVVVTYNRPHDLEACVNALRNQTYPLSSIIVIDNAGPVPARAFLPSDPKVQVVRSEVNLGGAGGFAAGLEIALTQGVDRVWLMDDDAIAHPDALEMLLLAEPDCKDSGVMLSAVYEFGKVAVRHRRKFDSLTGIEWPIPKAQYSRSRIKVDTGSFVGFLVRSEIARSIPRPNADYFLAFDDTEYSLRIAQAGHSLWLVPASRIEHLRSSDSRLRQGPFGGKHFLNVRNHMYVKLGYSRLKVFAFILASIYGFSIWVRSGGLIRPSSIRLLIRALSDGLHGRLGPPPSMNVS